MEKDEVDDRLDEIMSSRKVIETSLGPMWFIYPTLEDRLFAKYLYKKRLAELKAKSIPTIKESLDYHISIGEWSKENEENLEKLPKFIEETKANILIEKNRIKKKKFESWLLSLKNTLFNLTNGKNTILANSAEHLSVMYSTLYLITKCFKKIDNTVLFTSFEELESSVNLKLIDEFISLYFTASDGMEEVDIRTLAKNNVWRIRWLSSKDDISGLFDRSLNDLAHDQFLLVYWSRVYDSVYESLERPPDDVINDDDKLDEWLKEESEKRDRETGQKFYGKSKTTKSSKIDNAKEVFRVVDGYYDKNGTYIHYSDEERWKEIERIRDLNAPVSRSIKKKEEEKLRETPGVFIQENELRKRKEDREFMGANVNIKRKG